MAISVTAGDGLPLAPCGRCRQLLIEHGIVSSQEASKMKKDVLAEVNAVTDEAEALPYPAGNPAPAVPPAREGLLAADVPVDNSAGPEPMSADENPSPQQRHLPAQRTGDSARHGTFG